MKRVPHHEPSNVGVVIVVLFALAAAAQCADDRPMTSNDPYDACGGPGSRPVTIGGVMVIACQ